MTMSVEPHHARPVWWFPLVLAACTAASLTGATARFANAEDAAGLPSQPPDALVSKDVPVDAPPAPVRSEFIGPFREKLARYWNVPALAEAAARTAVVVRVEFDRDAKPVSIELVSGNGPTGEADAQMFGAARRAILRAHSDGGLPLPLEQYDTWRVLDLVFDANGMELS